MAGIKKRLGSLRGPSGKSGTTPEFVEGETTQVAPQEQAKIDLVPLGNDQYRVDAQVPRGLDGDPTAVADFGQAMAVEINSQGSAGRNALDEATSQATGPIVSSMESLAIMSIPGAVEVPEATGITIPLTIVRTRDGYLTNLNLLARHTQHTGPTYYVSPDGDNAADGLTPETAFRTPYYASRKNGDDWGEIIITKSGTWNRTESLVQWRQGRTIRTLPGVHAEFIAGDVLPTWTANGAAWQASIATCTGVFDTEYRDPYGDPTPLLNVASVAAVQSTPGTYHFADGAVTVRLHDGRQPDNRVYVNRHVAGTGFHPDQAGTTGGSIYIEGVSFWGGSSSANFTAPGDGWRVYAKDCGFHGAATGNGISPWGISEIILDSCSANWNNLDGFNYHINSGRTGQFIEINCTGRNNGRTGGSNNGSSSHGTYRGIRVGGDYIGNEGANVADVNDTRTFNVGCTAAGSTSYKEDFYVNGTSKMWLEGCVGASDTAIFAADPESTIYTRNTVAAGAVQGSVVAY